MDGSRQKAKMMAVLIRLARNGFPHVKCAEWVEPHAGCTRMMWMNQDDGIWDSGSIAVNFNYATIKSPSALRLKLVTASTTLSGNASVMGTVPVSLGDRRAWS